MRLRRIVVRTFAFVVAFWILTASLSMGQTAATKIPPSPGPNMTSVDQSPAPQVVDAEAAIVKSDWTTAETKLDSWLTAHPADARALFDAGYTADAQNRLNDAAAFYRRAAAADPSSFRS